MAEGYRIWLDRISTSYGTQPKDRRGWRIFSEEDLKKIKAEIKWTSKNKGV